MKSRGNLGSYVLLHIIVLIYGFTAILGKLISIHAIPLVWYRMIIAFLALFSFYKIKGIGVSIPWSARLKMMGCGCLIAGHWIFFFHGINISNVSVGLIALAATPLFVAIVEPVFFKRRIELVELIFGGSTILGFIFILGYESEISMGLLMGIIATFLVSLFAVFNGLLVKRFRPYEIAYYEMLGGVLLVSLYYFIFDFSLDFFNLPTLDFVWLLILGTVCTAFPFVGTVGIMKRISPFTVALTLSLEPVYGIILAICIFGREEVMSLGFYIGTGVILCTLVLDTWYKRYKQGKDKVIVS